MKDWLRGLDGRLRAELFSRGGAGGAERAGADTAWDEGLADSAELLAPHPFDGLYPHYLCAEVDAALGETDRYTGEMARYNALLAELAVWLRRSCPPPPRRVRW